MSIAQDLVLKLGDFYQSTMAAIGRSDPMTVIILATLAAVLAILVFMGCPICLRWFLGRQAEVPQGPQATQPPPNPDDVEAGALNDNEGRPPTPQGPPAPQRDANAPGQYNLVDQYRVLDNPQASGSNKDHVSSPVKESPVRPARRGSWESSNVSNSPPATPTTGMTNLLSFSFALPPLPPPPDFRNLSQSPATNGMESLLEQLRVGSGAAAQARLKPVSPPK